MDVYETKEHSSKWIVNNRLEQQFTSDEIDLSSISCAFNIGKDKDEFCKSGYIIGVSWIKEGESIIKVSPKIEDIDFFKMLDICMKHSKVSVHLHDCINFYEDKQKISVRKMHQDLLNVFLLVIFLRTIDRITLRGLKRDYVYHTENLKNKIKGRILVQQTIKKNHFKANLNKTVCSFSDYSTNCIENRIIATVLDSITSRIYTLSDEKGTYRGIARILSKVKPFFNGVERLNLSPKIFKSIHNTSFYKDYKQAIKLAEQIYNNITHTIRTDKDEAYIFPFTINMPELFERYCEALLRDKYGDLVLAGYGHMDNDSETRAGNLRLRPDFYVIGKYIVDAKYKDRYNGNSIDRDDAAQMALYLHYEPVLKKAGLDKERDLKLIILYPKKEDLLSDVDEDKVVQCKLLRNVSS
jgi:5-methylcytosine-specific restriction enzyme subunit McrC